MLFAAIEYDPSVVPAPICTRRSLEEVAFIMFGGQKERAPRFSGNAGNDALVSVSQLVIRRLAYDNTSMTSRSSLLVGSIIHYAGDIDENAVVSGPPLENLRQDFSRSQKPTAAESELSNSEQDSNDSAQVVSTVLLTPVGHSDMTIRTVNGSDEDEGEYDSEVDLVKGVYYNDGDGNVSMLD